MFSGSVICTRQKKQCNFYTGIAILTMLGKLFCSVKIALFFFFFSNFWLHLEAV